MSAFEDDVPSDSPVESADGDAELEQLLRADATRELSRRRERGSLRARVLARLDETIDDASAESEREAPRTLVPPVPARRWFVRSFAAAALILALGLAWLAVRSATRPNEANVVVTPAPQGAPNATTQDARSNAGAPERVVSAAPRTSQDSSSEAAPRASGEGALARLSLPSLLGRGAQPARALEIELSSWGRDTRAAARFLLSRVRFTPQERSSGS